jgi:hypothetical protein
VTWALPVRKRKKFTVARLMVGQTTCSVMSIEDDIQDVTGLDNEAPSRPDGTGGDESEILGEGQTFSWAAKIGNACQDNAPLEFLC